MEQSKLSSPVDSLTGDAARDRTHDAAHEAPADSPASAPHPASTGMLFGFWYPAMRSSDLRAGALRAVTLLEVPFAIGRDAKGAAFALADLCPHRAMPLSFGRVVDGAVECCYHGWKFDAHSGQCQAIPSLMPDANVKIDRIFAKTFLCAERDGYVWVYLPDPQTAGTTPPPVPELPVFGKEYRTTHIAVEFPSDVDQGVLGLLDPAHGPYVHQSWYWRSSHNLRDKQKTFEPIPNGFRMVPHAPSANSAAYKLLGVYGQPVTTTIEFVLPNQSTEIIRCGKLWFTNRTVVTPHPPGCMPAGFLRGVESVSVGAVCYAIFPALRDAFYRAGPAQHEAAGGGLAAESSRRSADDARGRRRPAGALVF